MRHVLDVSMPRSGHHLFEMILKNSLNDQFNYCEFYKEPSCCKSIPCVSKTKLLSSGSVIFMQKSHDWELLDPLVVPNAYRVVQYRSPVPRALSNYELHLMTGQDDNIQTFRNFLVFEVLYTERFYMKWIENRSNGFFLLSYEELTSDPLRVLLKFFDYVETPIELKCLTNGIEQSIRRRGRENTSFVHHEVRSHRYSQQPVLANFEDLVIRNCPGYYPARYFLSSDSENSLIGLIFGARKAIDAGDRVRAVSLAESALRQDPGDESLQRLLNSASALRAAASGSATAATCESQGPGRRHPQPGGQDLPRSHAITMAGSGLRSAAPAQGNRAGEPPSDSEDVTAQLVRALYRILLLREPDQVSFDRYTEQIRLGRSVEDVIKHFLSSREFQNISPQFLQEWEIAHLDEYHVPLAPLEPAENLLFGAARSVAAAREESAWNSRRARRIFFGDGTAQPDIATLLKAFVNGVGATIHTERERATSVIERRVREGGAFPPGVSAFRDRFHVRRPVMEKYCPQHVTHLFREAASAAAEMQEILPAGKNDLHDPAWPFPFDRGFANEERPALRLYSADAADIHVHPAYYVAYRRNGEEGWASANLQGLGRFVTRAPLWELNGDVAVVRDYFTGGNFSHFLFDAITRLGHFCSHAASRRDKTTFIFGGIPAEFHRLIIDAAARTFGIAREQCLFPRRGFNIRPRGNVFWFSDQQFIIHPAQYFHPESVAILRRLGGNLNVAARREPRLYISRKDAHHRRLDNEDELTPHLARLGFTAVCLAQLPVGEQVAVVAGAECVVAPHGMGLTHLGLHQGTTALVELFHPTLATAAYALLARAYGFPYRAIAGREVDARSHSFSVDVGQVLDALRELGVR